MPEPIKPEPTKGESLVDVHRSLPPEIQQFLSLEQSSDVHHRVLETMRSMMPDERAAYARGLMPRPYDRDRAKTLLGGRKP